MSDNLVVGLDIGGTSTRVVVSTLDGERLSSARAGGGNPTTHGEQALTELGNALRTALTDLDPARVTAATLGMAGYARINSDPALRVALESTWRSAGLSCPYRLVSDVLVGYAAGTAQPDGTVVVAGTGAIAARVRDRELDHVADGNGWLLGDLGSGYWIGREAVRAALADLDRQRTPGPLVRTVLRTYLGTDTVAQRTRDTTHALVQAVTARPPITLAALAPAVLECYGSDDPVAVDLVQRAAAHLADTVAAVRTRDESTPLVRGGGLLTHETPLAAELAAVLAISWPETTVHTAGDGAAAAAWLAALPHTTTDPIALWHLMLHR